MDKRFVTEFTIRRFVNGFSEGRPGACDARNSACRSLWAGVASMAREAAPRAVREHSRRGGATDERSARETSGAGPRAVRRQPGVGRHPACTRVAWRCPPPAGRPDPRGAGAASRGEGAGCRRPAGLRPGRRAPGRRGPPAGPASRASRWMRSGKAGSSSSASRRTPSGPAGQLASGSGTKARRGRAPGYWRSLTKSRQPGALAGACSKPSGLASQLPAGQSPRWSEKTPSRTRISSPSGWGWEGKREPGA
jgi:hypothetical protein